MLRRILTEPIPDNDDETTDFDQLFHAAIVDFETNGPTTDFNAL